MYKRQVEHAVEHHLQPAPVAGVEQSLEGPIAAQQRVDLEPLRRGGGRQAAFAARRDSDGAGGGWQGDRQNFDKTAGGLGLSQLARRRSGQQLRPLGTALIASIFAGPPAEFGAVAAILWIELPRVRRVPNWWAAGRVQLAIVLALAAVVAVVAFTVKSSTENAYLAHATRVADNIGADVSKKAPEPWKRLMRGDAAFRGRDRQLGGNRKAAKCVLSGDDQTKNDALSEMFHASLADFNVAQ